MKKFKAYDREQNKMSLPFLLHNLTVKWEDEIETPIGHILFSKNYVLCQYMGFNDKEGNEIYEHDNISVLDFDFSDFPDMEDYFSDGEDFDMEGWEAACKEYDAQDRDIPLKEIYKDVATLERLPVFWLKSEQFGPEGDEIASPEYCLTLGSSLIE